MYIFKRNNLHEVQTNITCNHNSRRISTGLFSLPSKDGPSIQTRQILLNHEYSSIADRYTFTNLFASLFACVFSAKSQGIWQCLQFNLFSIESLKGGLARTRLTDKRTTILDWQCIWEVSDICGTVACYSCYNNKYIIG